MSDNLYPIKQVAQLINELSTNSITVSTIEYYCKQLDITYTYQSNKRYLSTNDIDKIKQRYVNSNEHTTTHDTHNTTHTTHNTSDTSDKDTIIEHMNKEIEYLREQLTTSQRLLDQQQQLAISDRNKIDRLENEVQQYRLSHTDTNNSAHDNNGYINKRKDVSNENATTNTGHSNNNEDNNSAHETTQISNSAASHTQSDIHTDDISNDNKNEHVTTVESTEGDTDTSKESTDDNKNTTDTGTYKDDKGVKHKNKIGFFARIFGK